MSEFPAYTLKTNRRAKHVRLAMTMDQGLVVTVPEAFDSTLLPELLERKKLWIRRAARRVEQRKGDMDAHLLDCPPARLVLSAIREEWSVLYRETAGSSIRIHENSDHSLTVATGSASADPRLRALRSWVMHKGRNHLIPWLSHLAAYSGLSFKRASIRFQRTRWGSCSNRGTISLNAKLLFLPSELVQYVMLHELCHTVHMHHAPSFWRLVACHDPDFKRHEMELRAAWQKVPLCLQRQA